MMREIPVGNIAASLEGKLPIGNSVKFLSGFTFTPNSSMVPLNNLGRRPIKTNDLGPELRIWDAHPSKRRI